MLDARMDGWTDGWMRTRGQAHHKLATRRVQAPSPSRQLRGVRGAAVRGSTRPPGPRRPLGSVVRACAPQAAEAGVSGRKRTTPPGKRGLGPAGRALSRPSFGSAPPGPAFSRADPWTSAARVAESRAATCGRGERAPGTAAGSWSGGCGQDGAPDAHHMLAAPHSFVCT
ncbi:hypothetical protein QTO34_004602 [Cnephaeus nilssonii]|uniref:Uncharacterized protein n=1 Tax=Cnephaeus nilssonii TaxID=3371016 RepID=A0AA40LIP5_CNENI|nr:hypothetical protein QTO34_004602 [Eptesicus nilssonii]